MVIMRLIWSITLPTVDSPNSSISRWPIASLQTPLPRLGSCCGYFQEDSVFCWRSFLILMLLSDPRSTITSHIEALSAPTSSLSSEPTAASTRSPTVMCTSGLSDGNYILGATGQKSWSFCGVSGTHPMNFNSKSTIDCICTPWIYSGVYANEANHKTKRCSDIPSFHASHFALSLPLSLHLWLPQRAEISHQWSDWVFQGLRLKTRKLKTRWSGLQFFDTCSNIHPKCWIDSFCWSIIDTIIAPATLKHSNVHHDWSFRQAKNTSESCPHLSSKYWTNSFSLSQSLGRTNLETDDDAEASPIYCSNFQSIRWADLQSFGSSLLCSNFCPSLIFWLIITSRFSNFILSYLLNWLSQQSWRLYLLIPVLVKSLSFGLDGGCNLKDF